MNSVKDGLSSTSSTSSLAANPSSSQSILSNADEKKYRRKYAELGLKLRSLESENDDLVTKYETIKHQLLRLKAEKKILLEVLENICLEDEESANPLPNIERDGIISPSVPLTTPHSEIDQAIHAAPVKPNARRLSKPMPAIVKQQGSAVDPPPATTSSSPPAFAPPRSPSTTTSCSPRSSLSPPVAVSNTPPTDYPHPVIDPPHVLNPNSLPSTSPDGTLFVPPPRTFQHQYANSSPPLPPIFPLPTTSHNPFSPPSSAFHNNPVFMNPPASQASPFIRQPAFVLPPPIHHHQHHQQRISPTSPASPSDSLFRHLHPAPSSSTNNAAHYPGYIYPPSAPSSALPPPNGNR